MHTVAQDVRRRVACVVAVLAVWGVPAVSAQSPSSGRVAAGAQHTLLVDGGGAVWAWGGNGNGELGDTSTTTRRVPQPVPGLSTIVAVAAGASHSLALTAGGTVHAFGDNLYGQIGDGTSTDRRAPVALSLTSVTAIAAGDYHSMALRSNGDVYVWGRNHVGQIGNGSTTNVTSPVLLTTGAQAIAAGGSHTLVVKTDGTVWGVGADSYGQLGTGSTATSRTGLVQASSLSGVVGAAAGAKHSVFRLADGTLRAAGYNGQGQVGDGTTTSRTTAVAVGGLTGVVAIDAGADHTLAAAADGTLWSWGEMATGQLGTGATANQPTAVVVTGAGPIAAFAAGGDHSLAVSADGVVRAWGENGQSQLGDGATGDVGLPMTISDAAYAWQVATPTFSVAAGTYTSARTVTVAVVTAGATIRYTLTGADPTASDPVVASGGSVTISESQTLSARAWKPGVPTSHIARAAYVLQVVTPTNTPAAGTYTTAPTVTLATTTAGATLRYTLDGTDPTAASALYTGPLAIGTTTTVKAIGVKGNWADSNVRTAIYTMHVGTLTAPTISPAGGTVTGHATVTLSAQPVATIRYTTNGATPTTSSPVYTGPFPVTTTSSVRAKAFHPDYTASAVSSADYTVVTSTPTFSLPSGAHAPGTTVTVSNADAGVTLRWTLDGTDPTSASPVIPGTPLVLGDHTIKVRAFRTGATESAVATGVYTLTTPLGAGGVSAGDRHTLLTTPDGRLYAWGTNSNNQLGDGTPTTRLTPGLVPTLTGVTAAAAGPLHSLAVTADGRVWAWGYNLHGRLGDGTGTGRTRPVLIAGLPPVAAVAAGSAHSLALTATGEVYAWGAGGQGQLGRGTTTDATVPVLVPGLSDVLAIAAGANHSVAVTARGDVWAWGDNSANQVAPGALTDRLSPERVSGITTAVRAAAGSTHTLVGLRDGSVQAWGHGGYGKLGLGTSANQPTPVAVPGVAAAVLALGAHHSAAVSTTGTLLGWGANASGQVGLGAPSTSVLSPTAVSGLAGVTALALGGTHTVAVALDGGVWTWGSDVYAQLGDAGPNADRATPGLVWTAPGRWSPPPPMLSLPTGTYTSEPIVLVTSAVPGATLRYTTNGQDPTETDPVVPPNGDVLITGTTTLQARAWVPDRAPSVVAAATYTLQPAAPTLSPATGTYVGAQTVTLSALDGQAAIRYTTDGSTPGETSTLYTAPFVVPSTATVQARSFRSGWTPSGTTSATLTIMQGTLATPTASPAGGIYPPSEPITLSGPAGATIRYTTDGSEPTAVSNLYMGPLTFPEGALTLKAKAFQADWYPSATVSEAYTLDGTAPTFTASPFPSPIHGWHSGPVTVRFFCSDAVQLASCPTPITVTASGATEVTGTATDGAGNQATASVTVQLDLVPPTVTLTSPTADLTTMDTSITLTGFVADADSGLELVQCNGQDATVNAGTATCTVPLRPGRNAIVLLARDAAGHNTSKGLRVTRTGTSTALTLSPATRTLLVEEAAPLSLLDDFGAAIGAAAWTSSDPAIVALSTDDPPVLTGLVAGTATVTATKNGLSATATITVVAGTSLPDGTTRWTVPATPGATLGTTIYTHRVAEEVPDLFITEKTGSGDYDATYTVRATMGDGTVGWLEAAPGVPTFGDEEGGMVATIGTDESGYPTGLARFAGPAGAAPWRYRSTGLLAPAGPTRPAVAQGPDGTIFVAEYPSATAADWGDSRLVALDGASGAVRQTSWLPRVTSFDYRRSTPTYAEPNLVIGPVVGEDGAAYVLYRTAQLERYGPASQDLRRWTLDLTLRRMTAEGVTSEVPIAYFSCEGLDPPRLHQCTDGQVYTVLEPAQVVPDGVGGVLVRWNKDLLHPDPNGLYLDEWQGFVTRVAGNAVTEFSVADAADRIALVGDLGTAYLSTAAGTQAMDVPTWTPKWTVPVVGETAMAIAGGGVAIDEGATGNLSIVDEAGVLRAVVPMPVGQAQQVLVIGEWVGTSSMGTLAAVTGPARIQPSGGSLMGAPLFVLEPMFSYLQGRGTPRGQAAPPGGFTEREPAALNGLTRAYPLSARDGSEYGGMVCQVRGRFHVSRLHTDFIQDQVHVPEGFCPAGAKAAHFHTHPPLEHPLPSGPDYPNADANPGIPYYLMAPVPQSPVFPPRQTRTLKYWNGAGRPASSNLCLRTAGGGWIPSPEIAGNEGAVCATPSP